MNQSSLADLVAAAEAVLFVSPGPLPAEELGRILGITEGTLLQSVIQGVEALYAGTHRGVVFQRVAGGLRLATAATVEPYVQDAVQRSSASRLSQAALEVLSIVAYRQPITVPEINAIRGVNSAGVVDNLQQKKLVRSAGRKRVIGRPFLYRTTKTFLVQFGLDSLEDLPQLEEVDAGAAE